MTNRLEQLLAENETILIDGAMGTELFAVGLTAGAPPEGWNLDHQEPILTVHRRYIAAGSRIILTNTFGGTTFRLKLHDLQDRSYEINKAAAEIARQAADEADQLIVVAGSIGPTGEILVPMGNMTVEEAVESFAIQARGLADGGVDVFWIETMSDLGEVKAAVEGIRSVSDLPICATMTFDTRGRTMMGVTPQEALQAMQEWGVFALGGNCGNGPDEIEAVVDAMHTDAPQTILIAKANAGIPHWVDNKLFYDGTPAVMADYACRVRALGARIVGGCCGSTPDHIAAMAQALNEPYDPEMVIEPRGYQVVAATNKEPGREGRRRRRRRG